MKDMTLMLLLWRDAVDPDWYALGYIRSCWKPGTTAKLLDLHCDTLSDLFGREVFDWANEQTAWPQAVRVTLARGEVGLRRSRRGLCLGTVGTVTCDV